MEKLSNRNDHLCPCGDACASFYCSYYHMTLLWFSWYRMYRLPRPSTICLENGDETGGQGGALHSSLDATTILRAKSVMSDNTAGNGGAIYNRSGRVTLRKATFNGNQALVRYTTLHAGGI